MAWAYASLICDAFCQTWICCIGMLERNWSNRKMVQIQKNDLKMIPKQKVHLCRPVYPHRSFSVPWVDCDFQIQHLFRLYKMMKWIHPMMSHPKNWIHKGYNVFFWNWKMSDMSTQGRFCRICLPEDDLTTLISPCQCKGSIQHIHLNCLRRWQARRRPSAVCDLCEYPSHQPTVKWLFRSSESDQRISGRWFKVYSVYLQNNPTYSISTTYIHFVFGSWCFRRWTGTNLLWGHLRPEVAEKYVQMQFDFIPDDIAFP